MYLTYTADRILDDAALIDTGEGGTVRLLRTLNRDADSGLQGEDYNDAWTLGDRITAAATFCERGFWGTWSDINAKTSGGIHLYDDLCIEGAIQFMELHEGHPFIICQDYYDAANAVLSLEEGTYLFFVPACDTPAQRGTDVYQRH